MSKGLSGSTPHLMHHGVANFKSDKSEQAKRAIIEKYLSPPPEELTSNEKKLNRNGVNILINLK